MRIHQDVRIDATPEAVFEVLTDAAKFKAMTGGKATKISREPGGSISMFDGYVSGRQVELTPGKRVVQAWRGANWPEGVYSIVRFELTKDRRRHQAHIRPNRPSRRTPTSSRNRLGQDVLGADAGASGEKVALRRRADAPCPSVSVAGERSVAQAAVRTFLTLWPTRAKKIPAWPKKPLQESFNSST